MAPLVDLDGKSRPIGAAFDVGAYEFGDAALTGDFNHDGTVDAADYTVWRDGLGNAYTLEYYIAWKSHFGQSTSFAATAVPEPTTALAGWLSLVIGLGLICRGRRL